MDFWCHGLGGATLGRAASSPRLAGGRGLGGRARHPRLPERGHFFIREAYVVIGAVSPRRRLTAAIFRPKTGRMDRSELFASRVWVAGRLNVSARDLAALSCELSEELTPSVSFVVRGRGGDDDVRAAQAMGVRVVVAESLLSAMYGDLARWMPPLREPPASEALLPWRVDVSLPPIPEAYRVLAQVPGPLVPELVAPRLGLAVEAVEELLQRAKDDGWAIYASTRSMPAFTDTVVLFDRFGLLSEDEREDLRAELSDDAAELLDEMVASVVARREALRPDLSEEEFQLVLDELEDLDLVESSWPGPSSACLLFPSAALLTSSEGGHEIEASVFGDTQLTTFATESTDIPTLARCTLAAWARYASQGEPEASLFDVELRTRDGRRISSGLDLAQGAPLRPGF